VKLIIHLYPVSRLRMTGFILLLPLYAFVTCRETTFYATKSSRRLHTHYVFPGKNTNAFFRRIGDTEEAHVFAPSM